MELLGAALKGEHAADGSWHGDNVFAALLGGFVLVPSSDPEGILAPVSLRVPPRVRIVVVSPGLELPTRRSRGVLPRTIPMGAHTAHAGELARLVLALSSGDLAAAGGMPPRGPDRGPETASARSRGPRRARRAPRRRGVRGLSRRGRAVARRPHREIRGRGANRTRRGRRVEALGCSGARPCASHRPAGHEARRDARVSGLSTFRCLACGASFPLAGSHTACAACGGLLDIVSDLRAFGRTGDTWRDLFDRRRAALRPPRRRGRSRRAASGVSASTSSRTFRRAAS